jgi:hypothetical protein
MYNFEASCPTSAYIREKINPKKVFFIKENAKIIYVQKATFNEFSDILMYWFAACPLSSNISVQCKVF